MSNKEVVVVAGGSRYQEDQAFVFDAMDAIHARTPIAKVANGGCRGTDKLVTSWAKSRGVEWEEHEAKWDEFGKSAGPIRNRHMLRVEKPDLVVAFPGGSGTKDLVRKAKEFEIQTILVERGRTSTEQKNV